jgi:uncharacterized protein
MKRLLSLCLCVLVATPLLIGATRPPLSDAAKNGDKEALRSLIQKGANVNATEADGSTALLWATHRDDIEAVELLLRAGAKVNVANDLGATPLWAACQNGNETIVKRLLAAGANPNAKLLLGETPLMEASRVGNTGIVEQLIAKGADVNAKATRDQTALMWAVAQKHPDVVKVLLAHSADIHARSSAWSEVVAVPPHGYLGYNQNMPVGNDTPLLFAARVGDLASVKMLVAAGADANEADAWGITAMVLAAHSGFDDVAEFLLDKGADPSAMKAGFSALHIAVMRRDERLATALLAHGANASAPLGTWTPTRRTSKDWNFEPELIGATPLWIAARFTEPNMIRMLVKAGADPKFIHHSDRVPDRFPFEHRKDTFTTLLAATGLGGGGSSWVDVDRAQREPLALETVKLLVDLGVDLSAVNADGRTALDGAKTLKFNSVVQYLQEKGAKAGVGPAPARGGRQ